MFGIPVNMTGAFKDIEKFERAARRAREITRRTGTALVVVRNGRLVEAHVDTPEDPD